MPFDFPKPIRLYIPSDMYWVILITTWKLFFINDIVRNIVCSLFRRLRIRKMSGRWASNVNVDLISCNLETRNGKWRSDEWSSNWSCDSREHSRVRIKLNFEWIFQIFSLAFKIYILYFIETWRVSLYLPDRLRMQTINRQSWYQYRSLLHRS